MEPACRRSSVPDRLASTSSRRPRRPGRPQLTPAAGPAHPSRPPTCDTLLASTAHIPSLPGGPMAQTSKHGSLTGVKVLDMTEHMAGPYCTMILADMGAEVIKLERPGTGDSSRAMGDGNERNPYFRYINRNKQSLTLDYKSPRGREVFLKLVAGADVLVENYRATVMDRAWLCYDALWSVTTRLVYAQRPGFAS